MPDLTRLASLKVSADLDASGYAKGAKTKTDSDAAMLKSGSDVNSIVEETARKLNGSASSYDSARRAAEGLGSAHGEAGGKIKDFREILRTASDAIDGNVAGTAKGVAQLANQWGILAIAFNPVVLGLAALGAGFALIVARSEQMSADTRTLTVDLKAMGDGAGSSANQLLSVVKALQQAGASHADALQMVQAATFSGNVTPGGAQQLGGLALDVSAVRGGTPVQDMQKLLDLVGKGYPAIVQLNNEWNFLTNSELQSIRVMSEHGDRIGAVNLAIDALGKRFSGLREESLSPTQKAVENFTREWNTLLDRLAINIGTPVLDRLADALHQANQGGGQSSTLQGAYTRLGIPYAAAMNGPAMPQPLPAGAARVALPPRGNYGPSDANIAAEYFPPATTNALGLSGGTADQAGALLLKNMASDTQKVIDVTKAYLSSSAEGLAADARRKAEIDNLTQAVDVAARSWENLKRSAADIARQGAPQTQAIALQAQQAERIAAASGQGPAALRGAQLQNQVDNTTLQQHIALQALGNRNDQEAITIRGQLNDQIQRTTANLTAEDQAHLQTSANQEDQALERAIEARRTELSLMNVSKETREQEVALIKAKNDLMAEGWSQDLPGYTEELQKRIALNQEYAKLGVQLDAANEKQRQAKQYASEFTSFADTSLRTLTSTTSTWHDKLQTIVEDFAQLAIKMLLLKPLEQDMTNWIGKLIGGGGTASGGSGGGLLDQLFSLFGGGGTAAAGLGAGGSVAAIGDAGLGGSLLLADGGVFSQGRRMRRFASGSVFDSPTAFGMADGGLGVLGEAGPEAIMPLKTLNNGKLGVQASGGAGGQTNHYYDLRGADSSAVPALQKLLAGLNAKVTKLDKSIEPRSVRANIQARSMHPTAFQPRNIG